MSKRPPCVLYQSFLVLSVFVHDAPNKGTHPPVMHLTSLESHHSRDLREAPSLAATAHGTLFVPLQRSACDWTQVSLMLLPVMAFGADAPHRPTQKVVWLIGFADGRRKVKDALCYSVVKEHRAAGVKLLPAPAREGLSGLEAPQFTTDIFSRKLGTVREKFLKTSPPY